MKDLAGAPKVGVVVSPFDAAAVSPDGRTAYAQVAYTVQAGDILPADQGALKERAEPARAAGLSASRSAATRRKNSRNRASPRSSAS